MARTRSRPATGGEDPSCCDRAGGSGRIGPIAPIGAGPAPGTVGAEHREPGRDHAAGPTRSQGDPAHDIDQRGHAAWHQRHSVNRHNLPPDTRPGVTGQRRRGRRGRHHRGCADAPRPDHHGRGIGVDGCGTAGRAGQRLHPSLALVAAAGAAGLRHRVRAGPPGSRRTDRRRRPAGVDLRHHRFRGRPRPHLPAVAATDAARQRPWRRAGRATRPHRGDAAAYRGLDAGGRPRHRDRRPCHPVRPAGSHRPHHGQ